MLSLLSKNLASVLDVKSGTVLIISSGCDFVLIVL